MGGEKGGAAVDNECAGGGGDEKQEFLGVKLRKRLTLGWKGGPCTPVPNWKLEPGPSFATAAALSARKLGANLWEMQGLSESPLMSRRGGKASRRKDMELVDDVPDLPAVSIVIFLFLSLWLLCSQLFFFFFLNYCVSWLLMSSIGWLCINCHVTLLSWERMG